MAFAKRFNGTSWVDLYPKYYNGTSWVECDVKRYNGTSWVSNRTTYTTTWGCTWSQAYEDDGAKRTDDTTRIYQGYYSSTRGKHASLIGFDYASIQSTLSGSIVDKVEIYMANSHAYSSAGIDLIYGYHNYASAPTTYDPTSGGPYSENFPKGTETSPLGHWWTAPDDNLGNGLRDGTLKGIYVFANSTSTSYYGQWMGSGMTSEPQIRITYRK